MIKLVLEPSVILDSLDKVSSAKTLLKNIRNGTWDAREMWDVADCLDERVQACRVEDSSRDEKFHTILSALAIMFYSKDKFGYARQADEYQALERLYGRLLAALGT